METLATNVWQKSKLLIKGLLIGVLVLLLLIPAYFVENLIQEREARQKEAFTEVSSKWAGQQNITSPVLAIPYMDTSGVKKLIYCLPDTLSIEANAKPQERHRGIYQVMLYSSVTKLNGRFNGISLQQLKLGAANILWNEAYLCFGLSDARGLNDDISLTCNGVAIPVNMPGINNAVIRDGFAASLPVTEGMPLSFSATINLNGSGQLLFTPLSKQATVKLVSSWPDPSFTGGQLPDYRITDSGFVATWKNPSQARSFPQVWKNEEYAHVEPFGADLFIAVNGYQKTMRSVKYAILCILLTFAAFFIIETMNKKSVHPFQYALVGLALILFYTLLLSFSEYTGFNTAYIIASAATIGLIGWFVRGIFQSSKYSLMLSVVLLLVYSYVFTTLQLQDYSLLLGSIGLFLTLAVLMHFSRKIQW